MLRYEFVNNCRRTVHNPARLPFTRLVPLAFAGAAVLTLAACNTEVGEGETALVTAGMSPGTLVSTGSALGGVVEVARVAFSGDHLSTDLIGDSAAIRGDGLSFVVGSAALAYPMSLEPGAVNTLLPPGPAFQGTESMACVTELGSSRTSNQLSAIPVDAGTSFSLASSSSTVSIQLNRDPYVLGSSAVSSIYYHGIDQARKAGSVDSRGNWSGGATVTLGISGGNPPAARDRGAIPFGVDAPESLTLPLAFEGLKIDGVSVPVAVRDPVSGEPLEDAPRFDLPKAGETLELSWETWPTDQTAVLSLEYYGQGEGRCPASCDSGEGCCSTDSDCEADEECAARASDGVKACLPKDGGVDDRIGALICSVRSGGNAQITGEMLDALNKAGAGQVAGVILRVGWSSSARVTLPDVLTSEGTRQEISPVLVRLSDMAITRFNPPAQ